MAWRRSSLNITFEIPISCVERIQALMSLALSSSWNSVIEPYRSNDEVRNLSLWVKPIFKEWQLNSTLGLTNSWRNGMLTMADFAFPQIFTTVGFSFPAKCCFAATTPFEMLDRGLCLVVEEVVTGDGDWITLWHMGDLTLVGEAEKFVKLVGSSMPGEAFAIPLSSKVYRLSQRE